MSKGDAVIVKYAVADKALTEEIVATRNGAIVEIEEPKNTQWISVEEKDKAGHTIRTARFNKSAVLSVIERKTGRDR